MEMSPDLARKVANGFRQYRAICSERDALLEKNASAEKKNEELTTEVAALRNVLDGIGNGQIDPDDAEEKIAEMMSSDDVTKVASGATSRSGASVGIGRVHSSSSTEGEDGDVDALTSYLLTRAG